MWSYAKVLHAFLIGSGAIQLIDACPQIGGVMELLIAPTEKMRSRVKIITTNCSCQKTPL